MKLLLARHGNTFGPGDTVVWTGATNDIPLVEKGREQARAVSDLLVRSQVIPQQLYSGPLCRTSEYAEIIRDALPGALRPDIEFDSCLHEVDYGRWTGLTKDEVVALGDGDLQEAWDHQSAWPRAVFRDSPENTIREIQEFVVSMTASAKEGDCILCVSSNGKLRYFLTLLEGGFKQAVAENSFKVATGNVCLLTWTAGVWESVLWNEKPGDVSEDVFR